MSMENQNQQQEPQQQPQQPRTYNPFIDNVNEKPYTQMNVAANPQQISSSIPEPSYQPNTIKGNENPYSMLSDDFGASMGAANRGETQSAPVNPSFNNLPDGEAKMGAENMAKLLVDGYEQLHVFANQWLQISPRKIRKMVSEGEIDLSVEIPYEYGRMITAGEFIEQFNEQNKETLTVSKDFKKNVTPVLTRVLQKRGAGFTDEQYLAYMVGKDVLVKAVIVSQIRGTMTDMFNVIKDYTQALKENGGTPVAPTPRPTPTPTPEPSPSGDFIQPDYSSERFNFEDNETVMAATVQEHKVPKSGKERAIAARKKDQFMQQAVEKANAKGSYDEAISKNKTGKRGRKPKDYIVPLDEEQIAEAIVLREKKEKDNDKIEGLD